MEDKLYEEQIRIEEEAHNKYIEDYLKKLNKAIESNRFDETPEGILLVKLGFLEYRNMIAKYLEKELRSIHGKTQNFIKLLSDNPDELALISLQVIISRVGKKNGSTIASISQHITKKLTELHFFDRLKKDNPKLLSYLGQEYKKANKRRKEELVSKHIDKLYKIDFDTNVGDKAIATKVGSTLIDLFIKSGANIIELKEERKRSGRSYKTYYKAVMTKEAVDILLNYSNKDIIIKNTNMLPMLVKPNDWSGNEDGGYLLHKIDLVKTKSKAHKEYIQSHRIRLHRVYKVVNKLQSIPWRVNKDMLDLIDKVFYGNMIDPNSPKTLPRCYGKIPSFFNYKAEDLIEPSPGYPEDTKDNPELLKKWGEWNKHRESVKIELDAEQSRRLDFVNALNVAKEMRDRERFYFVLQLDYRGRVYYNNQFFNPQTKGYVKSMLEFEEGRVLDDTGLYWLKIHTANVFGNDKDLLPDRIKWFEENEKTIIRIGKNPIENMKDWVWVDSPFEYVAACMGYIKYLNNEPVNLPIQLDATNSGIQFYSGLVFDEAGAQTVNVVNKLDSNGEVMRADIYQDVADLVNKKLSTGDYPKNIPYNDSEGVKHDRWTATEALSLRGKITRSITKKNTMTVAYSVTSRGMMDQNWNTMKEAILENKVFWEGDNWVVNKLITELNEKSIFNLISGAKLGQEYLKEVASKLTDTAKWYSPLYNFPVFQPSFKYDEHRVNTPVGRLFLKMSNDVDLDKRKQLSSIAANFIHSLDSSLLMYCVDNARDNIGVIHDCFLVHPNDGDDIRKNYKEGYIEIMKGKPLEKFQEGFDLDEEDKVEVPNLGTLNLDDVLDSEYILS